MSSESFTLNTGAKMPAVAFGGWGGLTPAEQEAFKSVVVSVFKLGYKHIDGAWIYQTEKSIGAAIKESGIPREEIFVTTKLPFHHTGRVREFFEDSLKRLGVDYVDLYLIHTPQAIEDYDVNKSMLPPSFNALESPTFNETWAEMEKIYASGKAKAIGVSNFSIKNLEKLLTTAKVVPAVNQVESHPYLVQQDLVDYSKEKGIVITAYHPTGRGPPRDDPVVKDLATKYQSTPVQVILAWQIARGVSIATQSSDEERRKEVFSLPKLEQADVEKINALDQKRMVYSKVDAEGKIFGWTLEQYGWEHLKAANQ